MQSRQNVYVYNYMAVCQNLVPLVNIKIAGKWMFIPLKMVLIGIDPYPYIYRFIMVLPSFSLSAGSFPRLRSQHRSRASRASRARHHRAGYLVEPRCFVAVQLNFILNISYNVYIGSSLLPHTMGWRGGVGC